jgi:hypothetical protein
MDKIKIDEEHSIETRTNHAQRIEIEKGGGRGRKRQGKERMRWGGRRGGGETRLVIFILR